MDSSDLFEPGMYVRVPSTILPTSSPLAVNHFVLGQVVTSPNLDTKGDDSVDVAFWTGDELAEQRAVTHRIPVDVLRRSSLVEGCPFRHRQSGIIGRVSSPTSFEPLPGKHRSYFVETAERIHIVPEGEMLVGTDWAVPDCLVQLQDYELYPHGETSKRSEFLANLARIHAATHGIAEMIGARVHLLVHQAEVVQQVLNSRICRFMLADEVGLGKTIEASLILQGLRHRHQVTRVLIATPAALVRQWQRELQAKFRLQLNILNPADARQDAAQRTASHDGILVAYEDLQQYPNLHKWIEAQAWELLILDEVHNLRRTPCLYDFFHAQSAAAERVLVLTATPVERKANEYLALLRMLDPAHYDRVTVKQFTEMLAANKELRGAIAFLERGLDSPTGFSAQEFHDEIRELMRQLPVDHHLADLVDAVDSHAPDHGLADARTALTYLKANYRIDSRVFRNRRASLQGVELPQRQLQLDYTYTPANYEVRTLEELHNYAEACLEIAPTDPLRIDTIRILFHAAASSADSLFALLRRRRKRLQTDGDLSNEPGLSPSVLTQIDGLPPFPDELRRLERVEGWVKVWGEQTRRELRSAAAHQWPSGKTNRLIQVLRCARDLMRLNKKVLVFSSWGPTLDILYRELSRQAGVDAVAEFHRGLDASTLDSEATWFQNNPECKVLLLDETGGEGRNFQIADVIIHVDLPWTPALLEQRIGRVDRIGRGGMVTSIVPLASGTVEESLFRLWQDGFMLFTQSMSGMEIVLEDVQQEVAKAFATNTRFGLAELLPTMVQDAKNLREEVEEEQYLSEGHIDWRRRRQFEQISQQYGDGTWLRDLLLRSMAEAGYHAELRDPTNVVVAAKPPVELSSVPDFPTERRALSAGHSDDVGVIRGTLHRTTAVEHDSLRFFAPGDPVIDQIIRQTNRSPARASATWLRVPQLSNKVRILAFTYFATLDPRPLLSAGFPMHHLLRVHGYLPTIVETVYVLLPNMIVLRPQDARHEFVLNMIQTAPKGGAVDLGSAKRVIQLKKLLQRADWPALIARGNQCARAYLDEHCMPTEQEKERARNDMLVSLDGERAALRWLYGHDGGTQMRHLAQAEQLTDALLKGLDQPIWRPESVHFWFLQGGKRG